MFFRKLQKLHQKLMLFYEVLEEAVMKVVTTLPNQYNFTVFIICLRQELHSKRSYKASKFFYILRKKNIFVKKSFMTTGC